MSYFRDSVGYFDWGNLLFSWENNVLTLLTFKTTCMYLYLDIRIRAEKNLQYYQRILNSTGTRKMIDPRVCSHLCCCTNAEKVDRQCSFQIYLSIAVLCDKFEYLVRWMPSSTTVIKKKNCSTMWKSRWKWCPTILWGWPLSLYKLKPWLNSE